MYYFNVFNACCILFFSSILLFLILFVVSRIKKSKSFTQKAVYIPIAVLVLGTIVFSVSVNSVKNDMRRFRLFR